MVKPNRHGVYDTAEDIVMVDAPGCRVVIHLADDDGRWRYGLEYWCGGIHTGAWCFSYLPGTRRKAYFSRSACMMAARNDLSASIAKHIAETADRHPTVAKLARKAADAVGGQLQMTLFAGKRGRPKK